MAVPTLGDSRISITIAGHPGTVAHQVHGTIGRELVDLANRAESSETALFELTTRLAQRQCEPVSDHYLNPECTDPVEDGGRPPTEWCIPCSARHILSTLLAGRSGD